MTILSRSNIFEAGAAEVPQLLGDYIEAESLGKECVVLALSMQSLDGRTRNAIEKSLAALGFGEGSCTYATVQPKGCESSLDDTPLDARALFLLVEGLDPLCIIATDRQTIDLLNTAYRTEFSLDATVRIFGRPSAAFENLPALLETDAGKQKAWALFKALR